MTALGALGGRAASTAARTNAVHAPEHLMAVRRIFSGFGFTDRAQLDRAERYFRITATLSDADLVDCARTHLAEWFEQLAGAELSLGQAQAAFRRAGASRWGVQALLQHPQRLGPDRVDAIRAAIPVAAEERAPRVMPKRRFAGWRLR